MTDQAKTIRVRMAPSPTGKLHVGGARTALYNWAFARATGGTFILRIEDTDPERSTEENTQVILNGLRWLGLDWDEGPEIGGDYGPYFQTQRMSAYTAALTDLQQQNAVYPCFCTKETLDAKRASAEANKHEYTGYDRTCRDLSSDEVQTRIAAGEPYVWRLRVPIDHPPIEFDDVVYGHMSFPIDVMDDMIVMRSDGTPTYNFAVVCDDVNMNITHVIRGDDHLSNTPRQILIYEALKYPIPTFAHLPMILGSDGKKLSKRHGATSIEEFAEQGYLPDAMVNFLALLGWSLDGETTIIDRATLCKSFSLERVTKKDAVFDETKLEWMNAQYIKEMDPQVWVDVSTPWLAKAYIAGKSVTKSEIKSDDQEAAASNTAKNGVHNDVTSGTQNSAIDTQMNNTLTSKNILQNIPDEFMRDLSERPDFYRALYPLLAERETRLVEAAEKLPYMFWGPNVVLDEKSVNRVLLKEGARADEAIAACRDILADDTLAWECNTLQDKCRALCEPLGFKPRMLFQPVRVAVCGNMVSPPLFESIELLTRDDVLARIDATTSLVFGDRHA